MALTTRVAIRLTAQQTSVLDLVSALAPFDISQAREFSDGAGGNQANKIWSDERTLTTGAVEDLDFNGGALVDALGVTVVLAKLKGILILSLSSNTTDLTLFGDANSIPILNTAATTITLPPGGIFLYMDPSAAGRTVTAATGDIIQIANAAGNSAVYRIVVWGA